MIHRHKKLAVLFSAVVIFCCILCGTAAADKTGKVRGGWLNLRDDPSYKGRKISSYPTGTIVTITGQSGSWYAVKAPDGLTGYMLGTYLIISGDDLVVGGDAWVTSENGLNVRLRSGPGTKYGPIASYPPGTKCTVISKHGDFTEIKIGTMTGYMMTKFLTATDPGTGGGTVLYSIYVTSPNGAGVNLRAGPSKGNKAIGFYAYGTKGGMIQPGTVWSRVTFEGQTGYMMTQFLTTSEPPPYIPSGGSYVFSWNGKNVNLRSGPGTNRTIIKSYPPGTPVTILTPGTVWHFVKIYDRYGYMMAQFIITK